MLDLSSRQWIRFLVFSWLFISLPLQAAIDFPVLTGRVVDEADLLSVSTEKVLTEKLAGYEKSTGTQLVVVTLKSLQGNVIEDFGYQLGRHWGIGQKDKNTGALLIVAPNERKVRIEVGYGLEGVLTDAYSHNIIQKKILPLFKQQKFEQGILQGTDAIIEVLGGTYEAENNNAKVPADKDKNSMIGVVVIAYIISLLLGAVITNRFINALIASGIAFGLAVFIGLITMSALIAAGITFFARITDGGRHRGSGYWGGGSGSSGGFGGGFSGGGGSFGGGGASGGW